MIKQHVSAKEPPKTHPFVMTPSDISWKSRHQHLIDDLRRLLVHVRVTRYMAQFVKSNELVRKDPTFQSVRDKTAGITGKLQYYEQEMQGMSHELEQFVDSLNEPEDHKPGKSIADRVQSIAEMTEFIMTHDGDVSNAVEFLTNKRWHFEQCAKVWKAARGSHEGFSLWYQENHP
jgi:hypothetical protein